MDLAKGILQGAFARVDGPLSLVTKDELAQFHANLEKALSPESSISSPESTACVVWILAFAAPSTARTAALGKYLVKLVDVHTKKAEVANNVTYSATVDPRRRPSSQQTESKPDKTMWYSLQDGRYEHDIRGAAYALAAIRLLDVVLQAIMRSSSSDTRATESFQTTLKPFLVDLIRFASPAEGKLALELHCAVHSILQAWKLDQVYDTIDCMKLREPARLNYSKWLQWLSTALPDEHKKLQTSSTIAAALAERPKHHGNEKDPWHQLPAGAMLAHMDGNKPIRTASMAPVPLNREMPDPELFDLVKEHIKQADRIFAMPRISPYDKDETDTTAVTVELNGLGLRVRRDPSTGKRKATETYYGHSPRFLEETKRRKASEVRPSRPSVANAVSSAHPSTALQRQLPEPPQPPRPSSQHPAPPPQPAYPPPQHAYPPPQHAYPFPPPPPIPFELPPRPPNWQGPWPPLPPAPGMPGILPPPFPAVIPPPPPPIPHQHTMYPGTPGASIRPGGERGHGDGDGYPRGSGGRSGGYQRGGQGRGGADGYSGRGGRWN